ncbi:MAG: translocation/assembly module TamB domain-containing protein [Terracidiphilus sp.]|jgi:translocation and assembly module TamB
MTEPDSRPPESIAAPSSPRIHPLRRFFLRVVPLTAAGAALLLAVTVAGLYFWASSDGFQGFVRKRLIAQIEQSVGGRAEIASFHWDLLNLEADADGLVIHGLEAPDEAPYAKVEHLRVRLSILGLLSPRVLLRDLDISRPEFHLIVYPDGTTNQPHPRRPSKPGKRALDTLFDARAGHISIEQGVLDYEDRASTFDFQNRYALLDLQANDVSLLLRYIAATASSQETYRIEAGAADLNLSRESARPVHGRLQATLDLTRSAAYLRSLRITSEAQDKKGRRSSDHTLEISGRLDNFSQPRWQAKVSGDLNMQMLDPVFGYPFAPEGIARLDLDSAGEGGEFRADGTIHIDGGSYIGTGVVATGVGLDAHVHADSRQLLISSIVARLRQGGQLQGDIVLSPWLPNIPAATTVRNPSIGVLRAPADRNPSTLQRPPPIDIPVNGKVTAEFKNVALDTILDMVSQRPFQRLGIDTRLNGKTVATWTHGDTATVVVGALLNLNSPVQSATGEVASYGVIDGTYTQRDGAVDLRKLELHTPASELDAHGHLGAYPLTSPSSLGISFHSRNLWEFDTVLRDLGLSRNGKIGAAALPVALTGQGDFQGTWTGSLVDPHLAGGFKATQLSIEMPTVRPNQKDNAIPPHPTQPQLVTFDSVEASGSYAANRIAILHAQLQRGKSEIALDGTLEAAPGKPAVQAFDANSTLHLHVRADKISVDDVLPLTGQKLPVTGVVNAMAQIDGPVHALSGAGWVELDGGSVYGEPIARLRAQGSMANQVIKLSSITVNDAAGQVSATGSYDLHSRQFQVDARGAGIDVAKIESLKRQNIEATGKLGFSASGSGSFDDPHLEAHATLNPLTLYGEPLGTLLFTAHTANHVVIYDASTRLEGAELNLSGKTTLSGDYATQTKIEFSKFDIGALLKMARIENLNGQSALAGTVTVEGPLAKPEQLHGEARLQQLEMTIDGVHLQSQGGLHATMANGRVTLDPLHVTGEDTDMQVQGSLILKDKQQLDLAASGSINLKLAETIDPDLTASGTTTFQVEAHGPLKNPGMRGRIDIQNGSLSWEDIPNGLSQLHGTLEFNQNRLEVKSLTAMSGGGPLSVTGSLAYQQGLYADLTVTGKGIRIRYPEGVSSQADATLHLQGAQNSLLLSGNVLITRFTLSPDLDIASLASQAGTAQSIAPLNAPSNHIRLDVHVVSSPQLNFQNAYAKLAGDVDLRVRGTVASPSLLGRVSITEGNAVIAGTRYDLQHGDIYFTNPVRIEPTIDLTATARVEDYDITLGLNGTPDGKMSVTYRSDPPLPESDVVALLALGRTGSQQRLYMQQQEATAANPTTDAFLGGALNATVSSRIQKLFGAGSVKVDPNYIGALGNSTSRIIVEEQLGRNLTLTYATDVDTTGQQLIQAEVAINRHVSLLVARDESGVFSMVIKATRRYR